MNKNLDFLAIGDITTDAFIRIKEAHINCNLDKESCELCLRFGDKVPYESVKVVKGVGNSANAAVAATRLGLQAALLTDVGDDQNGKECIGSLSTNEVSTDFVRLHKGLETNYHYVLWYDVERTILVKHQEFPYTFPKLKFPPRWIYLSSLGHNSLKYHEEIADYLEANPEVNLVFQPGTYQMKFGTDALKRIYKRTKLFFCNVQEAQRILKSGENDVKILMKGLANLGPEIIFVSDGINGAYAYNGEDSWFMPIYPQEPYERTGAGDAFSSTVTAAIILGKSLEEALLWGPVNSASVVTFVGAQEGLLTRKQIEDKLKEAPIDYRPKKI